MKYILGTFIHLLTVSKVRCKKIILDSTLFPKTFHDQDKENMSSDSFNWWSSHNMIDFFCQNILKIENTKVLLAEILLLLLSEAWQQTLLVE